MVISNLKIVTKNRVIEKGYLEIENGIIKKVGEGEYKGESINGNNNIAMPGFIDVHIHGSCGIDFMDAKANDYKTIASALYKEGVTTFLATTLTSDKDSLRFVCEQVKEAKHDVKSLLGIHFEGPYICAKYKGAQNEAYIRNPDINEFRELNKISGNNVRYITMAPEKEGSLEFIKAISSDGVTISAGHSDASFDDMEKAIENGLTNTTHTHNAMSPHHHRNPGIVTAAMYFNELYTEMICDLIHVCPNTVKAFYKIVGPDRFMIVTDALKAKHSDVKKFKMFGLDAESRDGAVYLLSGPLGGSLLSMDQGVRNIAKLTNASLIDLAKISSYNQAKSLHLNDRGLLEEGRLADIVILNKDLEVIDVYKEGKKVN